MINIAQAPQAQLIRQLAQPRHITPLEMELIHDRASEVMHNNIYLPYNDAVRLAIDEIRCTMEA
jgi:hypothetical protein